MSQSGSDMSAAMSPVSMKRFIMLLLIEQVSSSVLPKISLLQKTSSSPVTCHATGFYPDRAMLFWTKDGDELNEGVDPGEILPNYDGTFQKSVELDVSSIPSADWNKYHCVFRFSNDIEGSIGIKLDREVVKFKPRPSSEFPLSLVIGAIVGFLIIAIVFVGICKYKQLFSRSHICGQGAPI